MFLVKAAFLGILLEVGVTGSYLGENDVFHNLTLKDRYQSIVNKLRQQLKNDFNMNKLHVRQLARNNSNATSECIRHFLHLKKAQLISGEGSYFLVTIWMYMDAITSTMKNHTSGIYGKFPW